VSEIVIRAEPSLYSSDSTSTASADACLAARVSFILMSPFLIASFLWLEVSYFRKAERTFSDFI